LRCETFTMGSLQPGNAWEWLPVLPASGKQILAQAVSNSLGEFQMEYTPTKRLRLYVGVRQAGKRIDVSLSHPAGRKTREGMAAAKGTLSSERGQEAC
jgi:hypothetical protein